MLLLLPLLHAKGRLGLYICTKGQLRFLVGSEPCDKLTMGENLSGIQHPGLYEFRFCFCCQTSTASQSPAIALYRKGHGKFQGADAALSIRGIQHCHPYSAGYLCLSVPQLPAVYVHFALCFNHTGNIRTIIRNNGFCGLLLRQYQLSACLICVQARFFQFQFH